LPNESSVPESSNHTPLMNSNDCSLNHACVFKMDLLIPACEDAISPVVESVMAAARSTHIGDDKELEIETSLREALANAIKHGCSADPSKCVRCTVAFEKPGSILIVVSDPGNGFDPSHLPDPTSNEHLFDNHGRGIFLINKLMDEVKFEKNGAEIHMKKY
jgi:serine/threonine-protein kinase RsbW